MSSADAFLPSPRRRAATRQQHGASIQSSSPGIPELSELLASQKAGKSTTLSGRRTTASIHQDASPGFTTASALWRSAQKAATHTAVDIEAVKLDSEDSSICIVDELPKPFEATETARFVPAAARSRPSKQTAHQPLSHSTESREPTTPSKDQPWKKYKASPTPLLSSSPGPFIRDDAPPSAQPQNCQERLVETEAISRHFQTKAKREPKAKASETLEVKKSAIRKVSPDHEEPLGLDIVPSRRTDWTPPTAATGSRSMLQSSHDIPLDISSSPADEEGADFRKLLGEFGCPEVVAQPAKPVGEPAEPLALKRKQIEPVVLREQSAERSRSTSPTKKKAPKKPRTITELATAAYRVAAEPDMQPTPSLLDYVTIESGQGGKGEMKAPPKKRASRAKKNAGPTKPPLLSPGRALKTVSNQDFVFGTSSQLAQEGSPTFLRSLHTAMRQSNEAGQDDLGPVLNSDEMEAPRRRSRLWDAAARDVDGDLFDVEIVDLAEKSSPTLPPIKEKNDPFGYGVPGAGEPAAAPEAVDEADDSFMSLSDLLPAKPSALRRNLQSSGREHNLATNGQSVADEPQADMLAMPADKTRNSTPPRAPSDPKPKAAVKSPRSPQRPNYEKFTDAQLAMQVSQFGFKAVKRRTAMIAVLDKCWESKANRASTSPQQVRTAATSARPTTCKADASPKRPRGRPRKNSLPDDARKAVDESAGAVAATATGEPATPTKRPRGRPRKDASTVSATAAESVKAAKAKGKTAAPKRQASPKRKASPASKTKAATKTQAPGKAGNFEIRDSVSIASSPRSSPFTSRSPSPTLSPADPDLTIIDEDTALNVSGPTDDQTDLFHHITKAIVSAPGTDDAQSPSWHEQMLLYDPIVVEDLAAWLNTGQLSRVGWDGEVGAAEVKGWCLSKSVCCVDRDSNRGKERKRF